MTNETLTRREPGVSKPPVSRVVLAAAALALVALLLGVMAGFGSRWGLWHFRTGFSMLRWSAYAGLATAALSAAAIAWTRPGTGRRGLPLAAVAMVVGIIVFAVPWQNQRLARSVPPIHDITTDTENPPAFVAIAPLRADAPNPVEYAGEQIAQQQRAAYPDIRPLILDLSAERAFQRALDAARREGWRIVDANPAEGRIEATDRTFWFGFLDDVVIRLTPLNGRTVVDVRSKSRVGRSDVGANARRIRSYLQSVRS
jgi:uncharacterized protein (DUF1499 family)